MSVVKTLRSIQKYICYIISYFLDRSFFIKMRNPNRIKPTLEAVEKLWYKYPDLRLGQLMWFIAGKDPFHIEDDETIKLSKEKLSD